MEGSLFQLRSMLAPSEPIMTIVLSSTRVMFASVVLLTLGFSSIRGLVFGRAADPFRKVILALVCFAVLQSYKPAFSGLVQAGDTLTSWMRDQVGFTAFWKDYMGSLWTLLQEGTMLDALTNLPKSFFLAKASFGAYAFAWAASWLVLMFAAIKLNLIYALGPVWVAAGVLGDGEHLQSLFGSIVRTLLWPVYPCFVLLVIKFIGSDAHFGSENLIVSWLLTSVLGLSALFSPLVIKSLARQGPAGFGSLLFGVTLGVATRVAAMALTGATAGKAAALQTAASQAQSTSDTSPPSNASPRGMPAPTPAQSESDNAQVLYNQPNAPIVRSDEAHSRGRAWLEKIQSDIAKV